MDYAAAAEVAEDARRRTRRRTLVLQVTDNKADSAKSQPLAASNAKKYNLTSIHLNGELICDS
jgi:hypothetical protein